MRLTLEQVAQVTAGSLSGGAPHAVATGVVTDSRSVEPGQLFVALKGERFDGHNWVGDAFARGAIAAVVSREVPSPAPGPLVVVRDTLEAYGQIAAHHRRSLTVTVAAVTGSSGKTTTKDLAASVLSELGPTLASSGTENNEIGVPRTLLALDESHRYCVVEMAMRGPGEIGYLARIAGPHVGVITNIGEAHVGRLGGRERVAQAKAELLSALGADDVAVLNADDFFFGLLGEMAPCPIISFGFGPQADVRATALDTAPLAGARFVLHTPAGACPVSLRLPGRHNVANALAAAAVGHALGASCEQISGGLARVLPEAHRGQITASARGFTVINDAYNANPASMGAALEVLAGCGGRTIAVLGDMLELGERSESAHRELGRLVAERGVSRLITVGPLAALAAEEAVRRGVQADSVGDAGAAVELLRPYLRAGDTVLVKASRALSLERVVEGLLHDD